MHYLIKQAKLIAPGHELNGQHVDLEIKDGIIQAIGQDLKSDGTAIAEQGLCVSIGWMDLRAHFEDPGNEIREDLHSGLNAAAKGGFTAVAINPATTPPVDNKASIEYIQGKSEKHLVDAYPLGTVTVGRKGENISEMFDMHQAGAAGFSDDQLTIANPSLLLRALQYVAPFDGVVMQFGLDHDLAGNAEVHEGEVATQLGLKGIPALAESTVIARDIDLSAYAGNRIHFQSISSEQGVKQIAAAKSNGQNITADVAAHQLVLNDEALTDFDANVKVMPPLRNKTDQQALIDSVKNGTIDAICSDHRPIDVEGKDVDFANAVPGIIGTQTLFSVLNTEVGSQLGLELLVQKISEGPRKVLNIDVPAIAQGAPANLTLFNPDTEWTLDASDLASKSKNTPFLGKSLKGKVVGVINGSKVELF